MAANGGVKFLKNNWLMIFPGLLISVGFVYLVCNPGADSSIQNLLSGLLGSMIGAYMVVWSVRAQMNALVEQDAKRFKAEEESRFQNAYAALLEEVRLNTFPGDPINQVLATFTVDAWKAFWPYMGRLDQSLIPTLTRAYSNALSHQTAVRINPVLNGPYGGSIALLYGKAVTDFKDLLSKLRLHDNVFK